MRVFIQHNENGEHLNVNTYNAYYGFSHLGWEVIPFSTLPDQLSREDIVVGYISTVKQGLRNLGITPPTEIDYPEELKEYFGRNFWVTTLNEIATTPEMYPIFIKPFAGKQFDGRLVKGFKDLIGTGIQGANPKVWCSDPVNFVSEYRCFVRYEKILDMSLYKGDWRKFPNPHLIEACLKDFKTQPAGCSLDFGVTDDGRTLLIEANDGFSLGCYGLSALDYAKLISARWADMTDTIDHCQF